VAWARVSREVIAQRFLDGIGAKGELLVDVPHNTVERGALGGEPVWLHRKGATPADRGPVVIAGSRGTLSYLICEDRALLYEEAPQAYKDVDRVVGDLVEAGAAAVVAALRPLLTYKTRTRGR
jgi:release factor H-coupled RctB family protein